MATILSKEVSKRGSCEFKVELNSGEIYSLGFDADAVMQQEPHFSFMLGNILNGYTKESYGDLLSYISRELGANSLIMPLYLMPDRNDERTRIGNRIRSLREDRNMEAKLLAKNTGIDAANLSRIEQGKFSTGIDTLCKIASALNAYVDIIPNSNTSGNIIFSMRRKVWVLPSNGYDPLAPVPGVGGCFWPHDECVGLEMGDLVVFCSDSLEFGPIFIVSDTPVYSHDLPQHYIQWKPWPKESDMYTKLRYSFSLGQNNGNSIIDLCKRRFKVIPVKATLLDTTEIGL